MDGRCLQPKACDVVVMHVCESMHVLKGEGTLCASCRKRVLCRNVSYVCVVEVLDMHKCSCLAAIGMYSTRC